MKFDDLNLPKDNGADDLQDSARLAGLLLTVKYPADINLRNYVIANGKYVRHPREYIYTFSRDQAICLLSGLHAAGLSSLVDPNYGTEGDIVNPGVRGHFKRCAGLKANWFQNLWLKTELLIHAYITPTEEPNQMLCMAITAGPEYVKLWKKHNRQWEKSILDYWTGWRDEHQLALHLIEYVESV